LDVPLEDGRTMRVCDAHLSAFSYGDGTLARQVAGVAERIAAAERDGVPLLVGGDFNALPPGDDPSRLGAEAAGMYEDDAPLRPLFHRSAIPLEAHADAPERWRTWLPFGSDTADRAIDHLLVSPEVEVLDSAVLTGVTDASDHLPLRFELAVSRRSDTSRAP
ncbi:MAG: endonuclease/exonuclease/phosphatase family protein, partial [Myxococcota bacterium]